MLNDCINFFWVAKLFSIAQRFIKRPPEIKRKNIFEEFIPVHSIKLRKVAEKKGEFVLEY